MGSPRPSYGRAGNYESQGRIQSLGEDKIPIPGNYERIFYKPHYYEFLNKDFFHCRLSTSCDTSYDVATLSGSESTQLYIVEVHELELPSLTGGRDLHLSIGAS